MDPWETGERSETVPGQCQDEARILEQGVRAPGYRIEIEDRDSRGGESQNPGGKIIQWMSRRDGWHSECPQFLHRAVLQWYRSGNI